MDNVLITGFSGLIGRHVTKQLESNYNCFLLGRKQLYESDRFIYQDLAEDINTDRYPNKIDYLIHLAQGDNYDLFPDSAQETFEINIGGTIRLLELARVKRVKKVIIASSGGVYGYGADIKCEKTIIDYHKSKLNFYQSTKYCIEILASSYRSFFDVVIIRPFFVYGVGQNKKMLFRRFIDKIKHNEKIRIGSLDDIRINPINCQDAASCFANALIRDCDCLYNISGDQIISLGEIAYSIGKIIGKDPIVEFENLNQPDIIADNTKMKEDLFIPQISIEEGLKEMVEYYM